MLNKDNLEKLKIGAGQVFNKKNLQRGLAALVVVAFVGAGGGYFFHQKKATDKVRAQAAQTALLLNVAAQNNEQLLSPESIKNKIAVILGTTDDSITYNLVSLQEKHLDDDDEHDDRDHRDRAYKYSTKQRKTVAYSTLVPKTEKQPPVTSATPRAPQEQEQLPPTEQAPAAPQESTQMSEQRATRYVYKVKCSKDNANYEFKVDAQTGDVLSSKVKTNKILDFAHV